jgi:hypothetical protein
MLVNFQSNNATRLLEIQIFAGSSASVVTRYIPLTPQNQLSGGVGKSKFKSAGSHQGTNAVSRCNFKITTKIPVVHTQTRHNKSLRTTLLEQTVYVGSYEHSDTFGMAHKMFGLYNILAKFSNNHTKRESNYCNNMCIPRGSSLE